MMQLFTGFQYLLIDLANHYGLDKLSFNERLLWANHNIDLIESLIDNVKPKNKPLYFKTCMSIRKAQKHIGTGHLVGFDAICSGIQVMSALTGCETGLRHTGLIGDNVRADAYQTCTDFMGEELGGYTIDRDLAKDALMKAMYGSSAEPKEIFGKDTPELSAFYVAAEKTAPGAWQLLQELLGAWQPFALAHEWTLPDGFLARVRVKEKVSCRPTIDELGGVSFTYVYKEYKGTESGISLPANVTHSVDAYVLRCVHRRCNYDPVMLDIAMGSIQFELKCRKQPCSEIPLSSISEKVAKYKVLYERTGIADVVILPYLMNRETIHLSTKHLEELYTIGTSMLAHDPFAVVTVHDEFKCHANNMNHLRMHYREVFAQLAESNVLQSIMNDITGDPKGKYKKHSNKLGALIRESNYGIC